MYGTCIFCNALLGRNETLEIFPVGRRLAFDAAQGRLWVVCPSCRRWNLSPLEERWEALEECERHFRGTRLRVSTEHIGLARLPDGLELVRIGRPMRPEFAAWRYGDQFGSRRLRSLGIATLGLGAVGGLYVGGVVGGSFIGLMMLWAGAKRAVRGDPEKVVARIRHEGKPVKILRRQLAEVKLSPQGPDAWELLVPLTKQKEGVLTGPEAIRVIGQLAPAINRYGGSRMDVQLAVSELERALHPERYFRHVVQDRALGTRVLSKMPPAIRLAIEMAAHEESERRALEGELAELELAWQQAEEIAAISDSLLLPERVQRTLRRLRGG